LQPQKRRATFIKDTKSKRKAAFAHAKGINYALVAAAAAGAAAAAFSFLGAAAFFGAAFLVAAGFWALATRPDLVLVRTVSGFSG
jgi:hypothetical protein